MNEQDRLEMLDWLTSRVKQERKPSGAIRAYQEVILYLEPAWEEDDG